jgi:hypothetical protein
MCQHFGHVFDSVAGGKCEWEVNLVCLGLPRESYGWAPSLLFLVCGMKAGWGTVQGNLTKSQSLHQESISEQGSALGHIRL